VLRGFFNQQTEIIEQGLKLSFFMGLSGIVGRPILFVGDPTVFVTVVVTVVVLFSWSVSLLMVYSTA